MNSETNEFDECGPGCATDLHDNCQWVEPADRPVSGQSKDAGHVAALPVDAAPVQHADDCGVWVSPTAPCTRGCGGGCVWPPNSHEDLSQHPGLVHIVIAHNGDGVQKECIVTTSLPLALTIRDALKGVWIGGNIAISSRTIDEVPSNVLAEIDVMQNPPKSTGFIGGGRHG